MLLGNRSNFLLNAPIVREAKATTTLNVNNTTGSIVMFTLTGAVQVFGLWGEVTTALSSNVTAAHVRLNDQAATLDITLNTGVTLSSLGVGTVIFKEGLTAAALVAKSVAAGYFEETTPAGQLPWTPFLIGKKTGAVTTVDFRYTTTNAPSSGAILWHAQWMPLTSDGNLA